MTEEAQPAAAPVDIARALRPTAWTALIACVLLLPLIGFNTVQNIHNELVLETRWPLLGAMIAIIVVGRFLQALLLAPWLERRARRPRPEPAPAAPWRAALARWFVPFTLGFAALYPALALSLSGAQGAVKWVD